MAELNTKPTKDSVNAFLGRIRDEKRKKDCKVILNLMADVTETKPQI